MNIQKNPKGYTLVEILCVTAIIVTLASISYPISIRYIEAGRDTSALHMCKTVDTAIYLFTKDNHGMFPHTFEDDFTNDQTFRTNSGTSGSKNYMEFFRSLIGESTDGNTTNFAGKKYMEVKEARDGRDGFERGSGGAISSLKDPWGSAYRVYLDYSGDGSIDTNEIYMHPNNPFDGDIIQGRSGTTSLGRQGVWSKYSLSTWSGSATKRF